MHCGYRFQRYAPLRAGSWFVWAGVLLAATLAGGCTEPAGPAAPRRSAAAHPDGVAPITNTDPCATRLHDLCGPLLLYYGTQRRLPDRLDELTQVDGPDRVSALVCPVSGRGYIYDPAGIPGLEAGSRVIIYDPLASHSGIRWGISINTPGEDAPLIAKVVGLPESKFPRQAGP